MDEWLMRELINQLIIKARTLNERKGVWGRDNAEKCF